MAAKTEEMASRKINKADVGGKKADVGNGFRKNIAETSTLPEDSSIELEDEQMYDSGPCESRSPRSCAFESKRQVHLTSERRRRESIRNGYLELKALVPVSSSNMGAKLTNAVVLANAVDYLRGLRERVASQTEEIKRLTTQTLALRLISQNYAQLSVEEHLMSDESSVDRLSLAKYNLFLALIQLWQESFLTHVDFENYPSLANSVLTWFEQKVNVECVPELFRQTILLNK